MSETLQLSTNEQKPVDHFNFGANEEYRDPHDVNNGADTGNFDFGMSAPSAAELQLDALRASTRQFQELQPMSETTQAMQELANGRYGDQLAPFANLAKGAEQVLMQAEGQNLEAAAAREEQERREKWPVRFGRAIVDKVLGPRRRRESKKAYEAAVEQASRDARANRSAQQRLDNPFYVPQTGPADVFERAAAMDVATRQRFLEENGIIEPPHDR